MKFKTTIAALSAVAMLAIPAVTMAAPPEDFEYKTNTTYNQDNLIGQYSSRITHNGWVVGGNKDSSAADQTTSPGSRGDAVQTVLAQSGLGRNK